MKNRMFYFAYGQNMNPFCMKECCSHAKAVCTATLRNYRLTERHFADIDPDSASEVYGVLYSITPGDKKKLDLYAKYLGHFVETEVEVKFGDETFSAFTYMMTPEGKRKSDGIPFEYSYVRQCRRGALHYLVPNSFRYTNVIVYGNRMTGEKDDAFYKNAVVIKPCTITGTLYDTGYGYPIFSPEGNTVVEAEYLRVPRTLWESVLGYLAESPFKPGFLVGTAPDGSTFGGWAVCMDVMPPRAKVIESGSWRARRRLRFDSLLFAIKGEGYDAKLKIDFSRDIISGKIRSLSPDDPDEIEMSGSGHLGKYWRREIRGMLRECHFERWQEACYSNGDCWMSWLVELKCEGKRVKFMSGQNIFPMNWEMFKNVVRLCLRLCKKDGDASENAAAESVQDMADVSAGTSFMQGPSGSDTTGETGVGTAANEKSFSGEGKDQVSAHDDARAESNQPVLVCSSKQDSISENESAAGRNDSAMGDNSSVKDLPAAGSDSAAGTEPAAPISAQQNTAGPEKEQVPGIELELPLFDDELPDRTEIAANGFHEEDAALDDEDVGSTDPEPPSDPNDVDAWFYYVLAYPSGMEKRDCPYERFSLEQWKELILVWPMLLQFDPPKELRDILSRDDFKSWTGYQVCEALYFDGQWLADLFPMDHITQDDFDACFSADAFDGPEDYWDVIPGYFPYGTPPQIKLPFPPPDSTALG